MKVEQSHPTSLKGWNSVYKWYKVFTVGREYIVWCDECSGEDSIETVKKMAYENRVIIVSDAAEDDGSAIGQCDANFSVWSALRSSGQFSLQW